MSRKIYFTPGPSQLYFSVEQHLKTALWEDVPSISHRSTKFSSLFEETVNNLKTLLNLPEDYHVYFTSSATEVWERISQNLISKHSCHFVNGSFGKKFSQIAQENGIEVTAHNPGFGLPFNIESIKSNADLISITLNETSAGFQFKAEDLLEIRKKHPDALIALDVVSIAPAVPIDFSTVDTAYMSVQKCFGLPAGLGIWIVNNRALEKSKSLAISRYNGSYHSLNSLHESSLKFQTPETPNVLAIYLLGKVTADMLQKGKEMMHRDTAYKAALIYQAFEENEFLNSSIDEKAYRSKTVCVADVMEGSKWLRSHFENKAMILGAGYGDYKNTQVRIANFPTHSKEQIELLSDLLKQAKPN